MGDVLPLPQVVAVAAVMGVQRGKVELQNSSRKKLATFLFSNSIHAVDPSAYLTLAVPKFGTRTVYNMRAIMHEPRISNYEPIRAHATPAGTAAMVLSYQPVLIFLIFPSITKGLVG